MFYKIPSKLRSDFESEIQSRKNIAPTVKSNQWHTRCISNYNDVLLACKEFYNSSTMWRGAAATRNKHKSSDLTYNARVEVALNNLATSLHDYFTATPTTPNTQTNFDLFLTTLCNNLINDLQVARNIVGYDQISYGQAQKMVNVIFKYLTCYSDYDEFADLFSHCHMPIDRIILRLMEKHPLSVQNCHNGTYRGTCWTALSQAQYDELIHDYCTAIDLALVDVAGNRHTYLELEYCLWYAAVRCPTRGIIFDGVPIPLDGTLATPIAEFHM